MTQLHRDLPVQHISIRVPWHDTAWDGTVCSAPTDNGACLILKRIGQSRDDAQEEADAGKPWEKLNGYLPPCAQERVAFMADRELVREARHPYANSTDSHKHLRPTPLRQPPYSAMCVPYRWMLLENADDFAEQYELPYQPELEEQATEAMGFTASWVQQEHNQRALLDTFFSAIKPEQSLCFFYAKRVPHGDEESGRVLIGAGRATHVGEALQYKRSGSGPVNPLVWDRVVQHSIRSDADDGFLLPYHEVLERADADESVDPAEAIAYAPREAWTEFSFGSEHVGHDAAIGALLSLAGAVERCAGIVERGLTRELTWIEQALSRMWSLRGPCPGLGPALQAFGVPKGLLLVHALAPRLGDNEDPWPLVEQLFADPDGVDTNLRSRLGTTLRRAWKALPEERKALLKLLSRFDLTVEQAECFYQPTERDEAGISISDAELLANPYLLYELDRFSPDPIAVTTVDRGVFPVPVIRDTHPLPETSQVDDPLDPRRVRAVVTEHLEIAGKLGDTLRPAPSVVQGVRDMPLDPSCPLSPDVLNVVIESFDPVVRSAELADGTAAFQLERFRDTAALIRNTVGRRLGGKRHELEHDWAGELAHHFGEVPPNDEDEASARTEKTAALEELAASRISVLVGPAGTGKTTLLSALCTQPEIANGGVLLLAPTGKARVQLAMNMPEALEAQTIAQFLLPLGRYDTDTGLYLMSADEPPTDAYRTLIIDESSMLTEEQLAATLDAVTKVERLILVGDPRQLPPIGAGRPFVDLVAHLKPDRIAAEFPRVAQGYAELTVPRRPTRTDEGVTNKAQRRADLMLAEWFSGQTPSPGADEIWQRIGGGDVDRTLRVLSWRETDELRDLVLQLLVEELGLDSAQDVTGFELLCGAHDYEGRKYFSSARDGSVGAAETAERWQILTPVRARGHGVRELNRMLQERFRGATRESAEAPAKWRKIPQPVGPERILYGDKVINLENRRKNDVWPSDGALEYVANGEIGVVVGQWRTKRMKKAPRKLEVEFSSQRGHRYGYWPSSFGDEGSPPLELAYAITVHKAQGSEFGTTFVVIPNPSQLLSKELLYTALTRQRERVVLLYQGDIRELRDYAQPERSETARRLTNIFGAPSPVQVGKTFLEENLIHRTVRGDLVRSKSEVIIANLLHSKGLEYAYEQELVSPKDGVARFPDFTIEDAETGLNVYWEHLGMLHDSEYQRRWERKRKWYEDQDIRERDPKTGEGGFEGTLIVTEDSPTGGIDSLDLDALVGEVFRA